MHTLYPDTTPHWKLALQQAFEQEPFFPAPGLGNPHTQSVWGHLTRSALPKLPFVRERLTTPDDDVLELFSLDLEDDDRPIMLLLHGLEGGLNSYYVHRQGRLFHQAGWSVALMCFRSCGLEMNRGPRLYHMGDTADPIFVAETLAERWPGRRIDIIGVSLGGSVLGNWLADAGEAVPEEIGAAAIISPPFDPTACAPFLASQLHGAYVYHFLRSLTPKALIKATQYPDLLDAEVIRRCRSFRTFDNAVTAPLHGFIDAEDYWRRVACGRKLHKIRVPTLVAAAEDDPFSPAASIPYADMAISPWLLPLITSQGGHVGFVGGTLRRPEYWLDAQLLRFFRTLNKDIPVAMTWPEKLATTR